MPTLSPDRVTTGQQCPYCGSDTKCIDSATIYGRSYGWVWVCVNYPECDSYCGCHPGTKKPLGRLADYELRKAKKAAHAAFDPMWKKGTMKRTVAYRWLSQQLGIPEKCCHIGMFDVDQCKQVIVICGG